MTGRSWAPMLFSAYMLAQVMAPTLALAWDLPRRDLPRVARPLVPVAAMLPAWVYLASRWDEGAQVQPQDYVVSFVLVMVLCVLAVLVLCRTSAWSALFCASAGYTIQNLASSVNVLMHELILATSGASPEGTASHVIETIVLVMVYLAVYLLFVRPVRKDRLELVEDRHMFLAFLVCAVAVIGFDVVIKDAVAQGLGAGTAMAMRLVHVSFCCFLLYFDYKSLAGTRLEVESAIDRHIIEERGRQYEESRLAMDGANQRMHDICHAVSTAVADMGSTGDERIDALVMQILDDVRHYDAVVKTGYEPLDTVLTERGLMCQNEGVTLSPMADGQALSFMQPAEVYTLVGGLLDAAIEDVVDAAPSERDISLSVRRREGMAVVCVEHFARDDARWRPDRAIDLVVERYDGSVAHSLEDGIRRVTVVLPVVGE